MSFVSETRLRRPLRSSSAEERGRHVPIYVVWELTLACDLRCSHCGSRAGKARPAELSTAECLALVEQLRAMGTREVTLIGGEAYLRADWVEIVAAIAQRGMRCSLQSGGRGLDDERLRAARAAGLYQLGISVDGLRSAHDARRGVDGSFAAALDALRRARSMGLVTSVNTQVGTDSLDDLEPLLEVLSEVGALAWRIGHLAAMGRAADRPELLLQPFQIPALVERVVALHDRGQTRGLRVLADNSLGYFGPDEHRIRSDGDPSLQWMGCAAGQSVMGIESDGTVKACPSLPTADYAAGRATGRPLAELWRDGYAVGFTRARTREAMWGFCGDCYYARACQGGCSWLGHVLLGRPGNNPYCVHRATVLRGEGLRERVELVQAAPGRPYDHGRHRLVLETLAGEVVERVVEDPARARCAGRRWEPRERPQRFDLCHGCARYVYAGTVTCPHCDADVLAEAAAHAAREAALRHAEAELRAALGALVAGVAAG